MRKVRVEFFGQNHCDRRVDALSHLDLRHHQRGLAGLIDADEGIGRKLALGHIGRLYRFVGRVSRKVECEQESACQSTGQQRAAGNRV